VVMSTTAADNEKVDSKASATTTLFDFMLRH
jgi:hypothetical protein